MNTFKLKIASPDGNKFDGEAVKISVRGTEGELAVMAGHIPFVTGVKPCRVRVELPDDGKFNGTVDGGILTVSENVVTLLSGSFVKED